MVTVKEATGCPFDRNHLLKEDRKFDIRDFGAGVGKSPVENTKAINAAVEAAAAEGGTVVVPAGDYRVYTIRMMSGVNLYLSEGSTLHAAKTDIKHSYQKQVGEGGNYDEPEVNLYVGLQDHAHSYFANSLIYGADLKDVMIYGPGLINGTFMNDDGDVELVLLGGDPHEPEKRTERGHRGEWFGNKAIALVRCENVVLRDFSIVAGGHIAIMALCINNLLVEDLLVDTNRDAFDIDCCQNVTVRRSTFNSLTDDAIAIKASYGGGKYMPVKNVLIEDCTVCGYDVGSVYDGTFKTDKLIAMDRCGPTARVKLGTESTCGYHQVTVRRVHFKRSRGFALEAVDGSDLTNIIFEDSVLENISSSPIFIKIGDRGRFPVTGNSTEDDIIPPKDAEPNVRLDNPNWVLPCTEPYQVYPAKRYTPSYNRTRQVTVDGKSLFNIVDQDNPCRVNPANYHEENGRYYARKFDPDAAQYVPDYDHELDEKDLVLYANASGSERIAEVRDIIIRNITVKDADPRYPIEIMGLVDNRVKNVVIEHIAVEYRGGLSMEHAVEQRQLNTNWEYTETQSRDPKVQSLPWLVNTFFLKNEGLLPRVEWDPETNTWKDNPFNIPELPEVYPEPSNWGILPAYGLYARHVENLHLKEIELKYVIEDTRHPIVLDDVVNGSLKDITAAHAAEVEEVVLVTNNFKRPPHLEYVPDYPYHTTAVENVEIDEVLSVKQVEVNAPAPGTPKDSLHPYETVAVAETGYQFAVSTDQYPLPQTVFRPFFKPVPELSVKVGETLEFEVLARQPAYEASQRRTDGMIYNERAGVRDYTVSGIAEPMRLTAANLPDGAECDLTGFVPGRPISFVWIPTEEQAQDEPYTVIFTADDGIIPVTLEVKIKVLRS